MKINTVILVLLSLMIGVIIGFFAIMTIEEKNNNEARWSHPELIELLESKELKFSLKTVPGIKTDMKLIFENGELKTMDRGLLKESVITWQQKISQA